MAPYGLAGLPQATSTSSSRSSKIPRHCSWRPASSMSGQCRAERGRGVLSPHRGRVSGRFLLGIGIGHPEHTDEYRKPYDVLVEYLDALDAAKVPTSRRVVAALGPKVLKLAAQRSAGAHPYLTTPEHTAQAHELIGNTVFLAPEHKVVLSTDAEAARAIGRKTVDFYLNLSNYLNNWKRLGFTDEDIAKPGSDKLIDAVVAHGTADDIAKRLNRASRGRRRSRDDPGVGRLGQAAADADRIGRTARAERLNARATTCAHRSSPGRIVRCSRRCLRPPPSALPTATHCRPHRPRGHPSARRRRRNRHRSNAIGGSRR